MNGEWFADSWFSADDGATWTRMLKSELHSLMSPSVAIFDNKVVIKGIHHNIPLT